jgi:FkbM family methyltransferase
MIKRIILGVLRPLHRLFRPITGRIATRLRTLMREAVNPMEGQLAALAQRMGDEAAGGPSLATRLHAIESYMAAAESTARARDDALAAKIESTDFKLLQLAQAVHALDEIVRLAANRTASLPDPVTHVSSAALYRNLEFIKSRMSSFAGDNAVLTYLRDESPIFVNTGDMGCPSPIINDGEWEPENTEILRSFVTPSTKFIDVGANVGYFSLVVGRRLEKGNGKVIAIEPHPRMVNLIERSVQLNRLESVLQVHAIAASDRDGTVDLFYPEGHVGQGSSVRKFDTAGRSIKAPARRLDDVVPADMKIDLVKIDVEGAELAVIRGMASIIRRSPDIKILFEKLATEHSGEPAAIADLLEGEGLKLYGIGPGASLVALNRQQYMARVGDILAARDGVIDNLDRARFSIYPGQLLGHGQGDDAGTLYRTDAGGLFFFGPYWHLPAGRWAFRVDGDVVGNVRLVIGGDDPALHFEFDLKADRLEGDFLAPRDLRQLELHASGEDGASIHLRKIELFRPGE